MGSKKDKDFYHSLSRKELQSLCKKYGLPANRSSSDMARSLASYLENQRLGSMTMRERLYEIQEAGLPFSLQLPFKDSDKDFYGLISCQTGSCNGGNFSEAVKSNGLGCCTGDKFYHKDDYGGDSIFFQQTQHPQFVTQYNDSGFKNKEFPTIYFNRNCPSLTRGGNINDVPQIGNKNVDVGSCSNEADFHSSINTSTVSSSSFQFHVKSEEGINLYVDLNSNPSEWVEKLKSEVSICQNMSHSKPQSFRNELGHFEESSKQLKSSFQLNVEDGRIEDGHIHSGLPPSLIIKEHHALLLDNSNGDERPTGSTVMTCAEAVDVSEHLEGHQGLPSFKALPDVQEEIISSGASSAKDGCLITLDSNINSPKEMLASDAMLNISDGAPNLLIVKHKNSTLENETCDNSTVQNGCNPVSSGVIVPGYMSDGSLQMPMPKDVVHQKKDLHSPSENDEFGNLVDQKHNIYAEQGGVVGSTGLCQEIFRNQLPTLVEEQDRSKVINWGESSECSHDELFENCGVLDNIDSNGLGKKRAYIDGDQNDCGMLDAKVLRSRKHPIRKVDDQNDSSMLDIKVLRSGKHPIREVDGDQNDCSMHDAKVLRSGKHPIRKVVPRRSMRLVSKGLHLLPTLFSYWCSSYMGEQLQA
ncbi:Crinkly4 [Hibiscus syriacus]|uniref:Crinkly4 n=1 Tax=Hibiscus syriacus TaxID=106335 RepID=A0A6A3CHE9_HIBSY|nr:Crinkly4 [Hibiscus syriacus]